MRLCGWGLGPACWKGCQRGVSKCRGRALGGGIGAGLGFCAIGGRLQEQRFRHRSPTGPLVPKWESAGPVPFCSSVSLPHCLLQGLPHHRWTPKCGWVMLGVGTPPLPKPPLRHASPGGPGFTFATPSLPPTPSGPAQLEGASVGRGSGPGSQQVPGDPSGQGKPSHSPF